jgi:hypothetical protein
MAENRWIYWQPDFARDNLANGRAFVSADLGGFTGVLSVKPGDTLWLVTYEEGTLCLTGRTRAGAVIRDQKQAEKRWKQRGIWDLLSTIPPFPVPRRAKPDLDFGYLHRVIVFAKDGTEEPYRFIDLSNVLPKIVFKSNSSPQLTISNNSIANPMELVNFRRLTQGSADIFEKLWAAS